MARHKINYELNDRQRELVIANMAYAESIATKYKNKGVSIEDLTQEAYLALCESVLRYDESMDITVVTFSTLYINGCLAKFIMRYGITSYISKEERVFVKLLSLDEYSGENSNGELLENEISYAVSLEQSERTRMLDRLEDIMKCLTKEERILIETRFNFDGDSDDLKTLAHESYNDLSLRQMYQKCDNLILKMALFAKNKNL